MLKKDLAHIQEKIKERASGREPPVAELLTGVTLNGEGTLTQQIYQVLRTLIVEMRLMPNRFLSEKDVASGLRVSKTPVREAFIRLSEDGMLQVVPKSGTYVSPIDINRAFEGYFIRSSLESSCAALLAEKRADGDLGPLRGELTRQKEALAREDYTSFYHLDNQFHAALFATAGLPYAKRLLDAAKFEMDRIRSLKLIYRIRRVEEVVAEHTEVVDAIASRDAERARRAMLKHFSGMNETIDALVKDEVFWGMFNLLNSGGKVGRRSRPGEPVK